MGRMFRVWHGQQLFVVRKDADGRYTIDRETEADTREEALKKASESSDNRSIHGVFVGTIEVTVDLDRPVEGTEFDWRPLKQEAS